MDPGGPARRRASWSDLDRDEDDEDKVACEKA
jgi:hypothetical protein